MDRWRRQGAGAGSAGARPDKVARIILGHAFRHPIPDLGIRYPRVNGEPSALLMSGSAPHMLYSSTSSPAATRHAAYTS